MYWPRRPVLHVPLFITHVLAVTAHAHCSGSESLDACTVLQLDLLLVFEFEVHSLRLSVTVFISRECVSIAFAVF